MTIAAITMEAILLGLLPDDRCAVGVFHRCLRRYQLIFRRYDYGVYEARSTVLPQKPRCRLRVTFGDDHRRLPLWTATEIAEKIGVSQKSLRNKAYQFGFGEKIGGIVIFTSKESRRLIREFREHGSLELFNDQRYQAI